MVKLCEYSPAYQAKIMNAVVFMFEEQHMDFNRIAFEYPQDTLDPSSAF